LSCRKTVAANATKIGGFVEIRDNTKFEIGRSPLELNQEDSS
jgi:hypothetical protein